MSMIAPESYTAQLENAPYECLVAARRELVSELESLEESFKNPQQSEWESFDPSPNVEYKMALEYLGALTALMRKRANEIAGEGDEGDVELERMTVDAIADVLKKALPAYTVPADLAFTRRNIPMLDGEEHDVCCEFSFHSLSFKLRFILGSDRGSNRRFLGFEPVTTVKVVTLTCEGRDPEGSPFKSAWNPETAEWSNPLPLG